MEEDRAAKAARAAKRLKKFQASKQSNSEASSAVGSPALQPSPALPEPLLSPRRPSLDSPRSPGSDVRDLQATIDLLVSEKAHLNGQIDALTKSQEQLEAQLASQSSKVDVDRLDADLKDAQAQLVEAHARREQIEQDSEAATERIASLEREATVHAHELDDAQAELSKAFEEITSLQNQLAKGSSAQSGQLKELEGRLKTKSSHADALEAELSRLRTASAQHKSERERFEADLQSFRANLNQSERSKQMAEGDLAQLTKDHNELQTTYNELQASTSSLRTEYDAHRSQTATSDTSLKQMRTDLDRQTKSLLRAEEALAAVQKQAEQAVTSRDGLQQDNEELMVSLADLRAKLVALTDEQSRRQERIDSLSTSLHTQQMMTAQLESDLEESRGQTSRAESDRDQLSQDLVRSEEQLEQARSDLTTAQTEALAREEANQALQLQLDGVAADLRDAQAALQAQSEELQAMQSERDSSVQEAESEKQEREQMAEELSRLQDRVEEYQKEVGDYQTEIEALKVAQEEAERARLEAQRAGTPPPVVPSVPHTPFAASPLRKSRHRIQASIAETNGTDDWPSSGDEAHLDEVDLNPRGRSKRISNGKPAHELALESDLADSRDRCVELEDTVIALEDKISELNALILLERDKTMKAMNEVFYLSQSISPADLSRPTSARASPNSKASRPAHGHRRSASHLPTLSESLDGPLRARSGDDPSGPAISPKGTTFRISSAPRPSDRDNIPAHARHARRQSLSQLKTRMEDELGLPNIQLVEATPTPQQQSFSPYVSQSAFSPMRRSSRLGGDHVWCSRCEGDLLIV